MRKRLLLGPQRPLTNLGEAAASAGFPEGPFAVVSAGWQEAEGDVDDLGELVQRPLVELGLWRRADEVVSADARLRDAYRERQDKLKELQRLYQLRLRQLMLAARQTLRADADTELLAAELRHAISQLRALDRHHFNRVEALHADFEREFAPDRHDVLAEQAAEIARLLDQCETVLITGGNVVVLVNRLRLFGIHRKLADKHLVAWSAGAMALAGTIVLYHDRAPQGRRDPEVLGAGAGVLPGFVFLPDARRRLRTGDGIRVGLFSRRFAPSTCVTLDSGAELHLEDATIRRVALARRMTHGGRLGRLRAA